MRVSRVLQIFSPGRPTLLGSSTSSVLKLQLQACIFFNHCVGEFRMSDETATTQDDASAATEDKVFLLGLTMAGAVSAGAYTAGVLDFLMQALEAHQMAFENGRNKKDSSDADAADNANSPPYQVVLKVMSGTSAGGVCTALTVPALVSGIKSGHVPALPILHDIWVKKIDLLDDFESGTRGLLSCYDLEVDTNQKKNRIVRSLLNSRVFDDISKEVLKDIQWAGTAGAKGFIADELELFVTSTNIDGIPYFIPFGGGPGVGHTMNYHAHVAHYRVEGLGKAKQKRSPWLERWKDHGLKISLPNAPKRIDFTIENENEGQLRESALSTGAFPVGLAGRMINVNPRYYAPGSNDDAYGGAWPVEIDPDPVRRPRPKWTYPDDHPIRFTAVDGGVCNNEPFELARFTLRSIESDDPFALKKNPREKEKADRAIIMIDPFPDSPEHVAVGDDEPSLAGIIGKLKATLLDQARFKIGELIAAADEDTRSRFLIAPSRKKNNTKVVGAEALASGFLGGFGGFFHEKFRQHDYDLGRRNCQQFLMEHFTIAREHETFGSIAFKGSTLDEKEVTVLSLPVALTKEVLQPQWPFICERCEPGQDNNENTLDEVLGQMERRVRAVAGLLIQDTWRGMFGRTATKVAWLGIRGKINEYLRRTIKSELIRRDQLFGYGKNKFSEKERQIIAMLYAPGRDLRTASGLCRALRKLGIETNGPEVGKIIEKLCNQSPSEIWRGPKRNGMQTYAHADWPPSLPRRIWGVRTVHKFIFGETTVDA